MNNEDILEAARLIEQLNAHHDSIAAHSQMAQNISWKLAKLKCDIPLVHFRPIDKKLRHSEVKELGITDDFADLRSWEAVTLDCNRIGYIYCCYHGMGCTTWHFVPLMKDEPFIPIKRDEQCDLKDAVHRQIWELTQ